MSHWERARTSVSAKPSIRQLETVPHHVASLGTEGREDSQEVLWSPLCLARLWELEEPGLHRFPSLFPSAQS